MRMLFIEVLLASCLASLFVLGGLMALLSALNDNRVIQRTYADVPCAHRLERRWGR